MFLIVDQLRESGYLLRNRYAPALSVVGCISPADYVHRPTAAPTIRNGVLVRIFDIMIFFELGTIANHLYVHYFTTAVAVV